MVNDEHKTPDTPDASQQASQPLENSGSQRNFHHPQRDHDRRNRGPGRHPGKDSPREVQENRAESTDKETGTDDAEGTEPARSSPQPRHQRGGRPEKRIIEESAYDPYCE